MVLAEEGSIQSCRATIQPRYLTTLHIIAMAAPVFPILGSTHFQTTPVVLWLRRGQVHPAPQQSAITTAPSTDSTRPYGLPYNHRSGFLTEAKIPCHEIIQIFLSLPFTSSSNHNSNYLLETSVICPVSPILPR